VSDALCKNCGIKNQQKSRKYQIKLALEDSGTLSDPQIKIDSQKDNSEASKDDGSFDRCISSMGLNSEGSGERDGNN